MLPSACARAPGIFGEAALPAESARVEGDLGSFLGYPHESCRLDRVAFEGQQPVVGQQDGRRAWQRLVASANPVA
jgi:hypothetical protein